jgi:hypothetical protein
MCISRKGKDKCNKVQTFSLFFIDSSMLIHFPPLFQILDKNFLDHSEALTVELQTWSLETLKIGVRASPYMIAPGFK